LRALVDAYEGNETAIPADVLDIINTTRQALDGRDAP
jgi:hypothetical protein